MEIRNNAESLNSFLGLSSLERPQAQPIRNAETTASLVAFAGDQATLSQAATEVSQSAAGADIRMDKVEAVQRALGAGTYVVPATEVADKMIDAMFAEGFRSKE